VTPPSQVWSSAARSTSPVSSTCKSTLAPLPPAGQTPGSGMAGRSTSSGSVAGQFVTGVIDSTWFGVATPTPSSASITSSAATTSSKPVPSSESRITPLTAPGSLSWGRRLAGYCRSRTSSTRSASAVRTRMIPCSYRKSTSPSLSSPSPKRAATIVIGGSVLLNASLISST
jgi:hypothetical protein